MDQATNEYVEAVLELTRKDQWDPIQKVLDQRIQNLMVQAAMYADSWGEVRELRGEIKALSALKGMRDEAKTVKAHANL